MWPFKKKERTPKPPFIVKEVTTLRGIIYQVHRLAGDGKYENGFCGDFTKDAAIKTCKEYTDAKRNKVIVSEKNIYP